MTTWNVRNQIRRHCRGPFPRLQRSASSSLSSPWRSCKRVCRPWLPCFPPHPLPALPANRLLDFQDHSDWKVLPRMSDANASSALPEHLVRAVRAEKNPTVALQPLDDHPAVAFTRNARKNAHGTAWGQAMIARRFIDVLNWGVLVAPGVMGCKDGSLLAGCEVTGIDVEGMPESRPSSRLSRHSFRSLKATARPGFSATASLSDPWQAPGPGAPSHTGGPEPGCPHANSIEASSKDAARPFLAWRQPHLSFLASLPAASSKETPIWSPTFFRRGSWTAMSMMASMAEATGVRAAPSPPWLPRPVT